MGLMICEDINTELESINKDLLFHEIELKSEILKKLALNFEFEQYAVCARFSNGETLYSKVS